MKFSPKKYLDKKINQDNCNHEILTTSGFDDGMYGSNYECLICGKNIHVSVYGEFVDIKNTKKVIERFNPGNHFIKYDLGCLTPNLKEVMKKTLEQICLNNKENKYIDIVKIFKQFDPFIDSEIRKIIEENLKPENKKKILEKYKKYIKK